MTHEKMCIGIKFSIWSFIVIFVYASCYVTLRMCKSGPPVANKKVLVNSKNYYCFCVEWKIINELAIFFIKWKNMSIFQMKKKIFKHFSVKREPLFLHWSFWPFWRNLLSSTIPYEPFSDLWFSCHVIGLL